VGDGVLLLDSRGSVEYSSPNAVSALHRMGIHANADGMTLSELGFEETAVRTAFAIAAPVTEEIERGPVTVLVRCIPLLDPKGVSGAVVLIRDISELRRRDRLLISKDATIREIHHRVKNNLQTISSLLRLQGRRLASPEAKAAIEESVRRIRSIALVHETLSRDAGDEVPFTEILRPLVRMVEEGLTTPERTRFEVVGDAGRLPATIATPLAVVLTELLQNAVEHGFGTPDGDGDGDDGGGGAGGDGGVGGDSAAASGGRVVVELANHGHTLVVQVRDDGEGLPPGFTLEGSSGLGLSIVRTLVSELEGSIEVYPGPGGRGTTVHVRVPTATVRTA
jgi:two-component sensor histidine kinase